MINNEALPSFDLEALLSHYGQVNPSEMNKVNQFLKFYRSSDQVFHRSHLKGHFTASAVLLNPDQSSALMTLHRKLNKWLQLGGHADGEKNLWKVALQEAQEESGGIECSLLDTTILDIDVHQIPGRPNEPKHLHWDLRFLIQAHSEDFQITSESKDLAWVPLHDEKWLHEESLKRLSIKTLTHIREE